MDKTGKTIVTPPANDSDSSGTGSGTSVRRQGTVDDDTSTSLAHRAVALVNYSAMQIAQFSNLQVQNYINDNNIQPDNEHNVFARDNNGIVTFQQTLTYHISIRDAINNATASKKHNDGVSTKTSMKQLKQQFYEIIIKEAKHTADTSPQEIYEKYANLANAQHVECIRIAYQSLENTNLNTNKFTKLAFDVDQAREESGECVCIQREHKNDTSIDKPIQMTKKTETLQLHDILNHIAAQAVLTCQNAPVKPSIIILGECGDQLKYDDTKADYIPFYLKHKNIAHAYSKMCCFVLKELTQDFKTSPLELNNNSDDRRPGFLIEWQSWKLCFIHLPNEIAQDKGERLKYFNGLEGITLLAGDFNYPPSRIKNHQNYFDFAYPDKDREIPFTDFALDNANGTNSTNTKVYDGLLGRTENIYAQAKYTDQEGVKQETVFNVIPIGLISRVICNSDGLGQTYTDHQGFAFDITSAYTTENEKQENESHERKLWYNNWIDSFNRNSLATPTVDSASSGTDSTIVNDLAVKIAQFSNLQVQNYINDNNIQPDNEHNVFVRDNNGIVTFQQTLTYYISITDVMHTTGAILECTCTDFHE